MKWIKALPFFLFAFPFFQKAAAQIAKTEGEYLRKDSILWKEYYQKDDSLARIAGESPDQKDRIQAEREALLAWASKGNCALAMEYASTPSGLQRLFWVRMNIGKDTLQQILSSLPKEMQSSPYGQSLKQHIDYPQVKEGGRCYYFACTADGGTPLDWESMLQKKLLIVYGGIDCMGSDGRDFLNRLYDETAREDFDIIYYAPATSQEELAQVKKRFPEIRFHVVSDLKGDHSPMKIRYGSQAQPTCYLVNEQGIVEQICFGIRPSVIGTFARPQAASAEEGEILIRGTIYGENREPLSGANVTETDGDGRVVSATKTDSNGKFSFKIRSREHDINFQQNGYYKQQQPIGSKSVFYIQMEIDPYVE